MIDEASRKMALSIVERGRAAGNGRGAPHEPRAARRSPRARRRAVRRRALGDAAARRPRRRGDQDRGPVLGGDVGRYVPPFQEGESSLFFETFNRNKRSVSLDLRHPEVAARVRGSRARVRRGLLEPPRRPAGEARVALRRPRARQADASSAARSPASAWTARARARAPTTGRCRGSRAGRASPGEPDGPPTKSGLSLVDFCGGYVAAIAILAGVWRARRDGRGGDIDLSLFETALAQLTYVGTWVASHGYEPVRRANSAHQSIVPFQNFETADGWIVDRLSEAGALGAALRRDRARRSCSTDERFRTLRAAATSTARRSSPCSSRRSARRPTGRVARRPRGGRRPVRARERRRGGARGRPGRGARGGRRDRPSGPRRRAPGRAPAPHRRLHDRRPRAGPFRGEHTAAVLRELCGYTEAADRRARRDGVFGDIPLASEAHEMTRAVARTLPRGLRGRRRLPKPARPDGHARPTTPGSRSLTMNTNQMHFNRPFAERTEFGQPLVVSTPDARDRARALGRATRARTPSRTSAGTRSSCRSRSSPATRCGPSPRC